MSDRREYVAHLFKIFSFAEEALSQMLEAYDKIYSCDESRILFEQQIAVYENDMMFYINGAFTNVRRACELCGARAETGLLLYIICLTEHLKKRYTDKGYSDDMYAGVIADIRAKSEECFTVRGIYGTFVEGWFTRFFDLTMFSLGRLEFEPIYTWSEAVFEDETIKLDTLAINVHIPSGKPLDIEECKKSFEAAYDMFAPLFLDGVVLFRCGSWLLAPDNKKLLKPDSNILKFMDFFKITEINKSIEEDFWRIFGTENTSDISELPRDTSIRRIYAECAERGEIPKLGVGIFRMKDREIFR